MSTTDFRLFPKWLVGQRCDRSGCGDRCKAYEGNCYARIGAGRTEYGRTGPNELSRSDFRIPEMDTTGVCGDDLEKIEFCFSFAMRFETRDYCSLGYDDLFTIEVEVGGGGSPPTTTAIARKSNFLSGKKLFEETIAVCDVGDKGSMDWEVKEVKLPHVSTGEATYFSFRATIINVGNSGIGSIGYIDDLKIHECTPTAGDVTTSAPTSMPRAGDMTLPEPTSAAVVAGAKMAFAAAMGGFALLFLF